MCVMVLPVTMATLTYFVDQPHATYYDLHVTCKCAQENIQIFSFKTLETDKNQTWTFLKNDPVWELENTGQVLLQRKTHLSEHYFHGPSFANTVKKESSKVGRIIKKIQNGPGHAYQQKPVCLAASRAADTWETPPLSGNKKLFEAAVWCTLDVQNHPHKMPKFCTKRQQPFGRKKALVLKLAQNNRKGSFQTARQTSPSMKDEKLLLVWLLLSFFI